MQKKNAVNEPINDKQIELLRKASVNIENQNASALSFINMLLVNIRQMQLPKVKLENCSIKSCVEVALENYPFYSTQREKLHVNLSKDFHFMGNQDLFLHVIFNLVKNALYYIQKSGEGEIYIESFSGDKENRLVFKDTGTGILPEDVSHVFDRFFSRTPHGAGIGLAFCKLVMQSFDGQIKCQSTFGESTEFILIFPKLQE